MAGAEGLRKEETGLDGCSNSEKITGQRNKERVPDSAESWTGLGDVTPQGQKRVIFKLFLSTGLRSLGAGEEIDKKLKLGRPLTKEGRRIYPALERSGQRGMLETCG